MILSSLKPPLSFPSVSGAICTFNSQYAGLPLKSHKVAIDSVSGVSAIHISQIAVCVIDQQFELGGYRNTDGAKYNTDTRLRSVNRYFVKPNMEFYLSMPTSGMWVYEYNINGTFINRYQLSAGNTYTVHTGAYQIALEIYGGYGTTYNNNISLNYPSTDTSYHEYQGTRTTINIGQSVNEGEYDARTGILEVTLPTVQTIQLPPCPIDTLEINNVWADTGDSTLQYPKFG